MGGDGDTDFTADGRGLVSTHAPAWGATKSPGATGCGLCFNSRPRMGGDEVVIFLPVGNPFQLTPPHGGRLSLLLELQLVTIVSTHAPAWGATASCGHFGDNFSVSTHAPAWGATSISLAATSKARVSTHAPAWGATMIPSISEGIPAFQLTPPHGGRR